MPAPASRRRPRAPIVTAALIVAAGRGHRLGGAVPKQYLPLAGAVGAAPRLETFARHPADRRRPRGHQSRRPGPLRRGRRGLALLPPVDGGASRQESVRLGLEGLAGSEPGPRADP